MDFRTINQLYFKGIKDLNLSITDINHTTFNELNYLILLNNQLENERNKQESNVNNYDALSNNIPQGINMEGNKG